MSSLSNKCGGGGWTLVMKLDGNKVNIIVLDRAETKALIGGGGVYSRSARRISFEISCHYR